MTTIFEVEAAKHCPESLLLREESSERALMYLTPVCYIYSITELEWRTEKDMSIAYLYT